MASPELVEVVAELKAATDVLAGTLKKGLPKEPYTPVDLKDAMSQLDTLLAVVSRVTAITEEIASANTTPSLGLGKHFEGR